MQERVHEVFNVLLAEAWEAVTESDDRESLAHCDYVVIATRKPS